MCVATSVCVSSHPQMLRGFKGKLSLLALFTSIYFLLQPCQRERQSLTILSIFISKYIEIQYSALKCGDLDLNEPAKLLNTNIQTLWFSCILIHRIIPKKVSMRYAVILYRYLS